MRDSGLEDAMGTLDLERTAEGSEVRETKKPRPVYQAGTLTYSLGSLILLFFWLLWGYFCYIMLETVMPRLVPLMLKDFKASNTLIGVLVGSIPGIIGIAVMPAFLVISDRHRGPWGRRRPFLMWTSPLAALFIILIGVAPDIGRWLEANMLANVTKLSSLNFILLTIGTLVTLFNLFNAFMSGMYNCLLADVLPANVVGRFMALSRTVGTSAGFLFNRYLFSMGDSHRREIFLGVGLLYLLSFMLMCWRVKEGTYPPPAENKTGQGLWGSVRNYCQESFSVPLYLYYFGMNICFGLTGCMMPFYTIFFKQDLNMSMGEIGDYLAWVYLVEAISCIPMGWVCDRISPVRLTAISLALMIPNSLLCLFLVYGKISLTVIQIVFTPAWSGFAVATTAAGILLLPKAKYGQYISAMGVVGSVAGIAGNLAAGMIFDWIRCYRLLFLWYAFFQTLALIAAIALYLEWRRHAATNCHISPNIEEGGSQPCSGE